VPPDGPRPRLKDRVKVPARRWCFSKTSDQPPLPTADEPGRPPAFCRQGDHRPEFRPSARVRGMQQVARFFAPRFNQPGNRPGRLRTVLSPLAVVTTTMSASGPPAASMNRCAASSGTSPPPTNDQRPVAGRRVRACRRQNESEGTESRPGPRDAGPANHLPFPSTSVLNKPGFVADWGQIRPRRSIRP